MLTGPGHTAFAVIPNAAFSLAIDLANPITPALAAAYTAPPREPFRPASDEILVLTHKTGPDGLRKIGHNSRWRGACDAEKEVFRRTDRLCPEAGGNRDASRRDLPQDGRCRGTFYRWKKVYAGMGVAEIRRLKQLEEENAKLKRLVADLTLDKTMLQDALRKKW